jgi:hypothetical protein
MNDSDIQALRRRLTPEYLTENTRIFSYEESGVEGLKIADRFRQYWKTWVEQELSSLFRHIEKLTVNQPVDYELVPVRHFGRIIAVNARIGDTLFVPIDGGVLIIGPGYKRTVMNSFYNDINTDNL